MYLNGFIFFFFLKITKNEFFKSFFLLYFKAACQCYLETPSTSINSGGGSLDFSDRIWLGCSRQKMPQVFSALNALNETLISKLWIWDSLINIIPTDMFAQVYFFFCFFFPEMICEEEEII